MDQPRALPWDQAQTALREWYASGLGEELHERIAGRTGAILRDLYALHCVQIGGTKYGVDLLTGRGLIHRVHLTGDGCDGMRADPAALPLATRSVDLVVLAHALEFYPDPHRLLREVDRVLTLDGHVLAIGFNPWSLFGIRRALAGNWIPWSGYFYSTGRVADWLTLLGIRIRWRETLWHRLPAQRRLLRHRLSVMERIGRVLPGTGGIYLLLARKHSVPMTPVALGWDWTPARVRVRGPARPMGRCEGLRGGATSDGYEGG